MNCDFSDFINWFW